MQQLGRIAPRHWLTYPKSVRLVIWTAVGAEEQIHQRFQELADQMVASVLAEATSTSPALECEKKG